MNGALPFVAYLSTDDRCTGSKLVASKIQQHRLEQSIALVLVNDQKLSELPEFLTGTPTLYATNNHVVYEGGQDCAELLEALANAARKKAVTESYGNEPQRRPGEYTEQVPSSPTAKKSSEELQRAMNARIGK